MTKYYTMKECFDACGDDDYPFISWGFNDGCRVSKKDILRDQSKHAVFPKWALSDQWQIKRAEPVLSAEDICEKNVGGFTGFLSADQYIDTLTDCAREGIKNGQLKEWLRPEQIELRLAVKIIHETYMEYQGAYPKISRIQFTPRLIERISNAYTSLESPSKND